MESFDSDVASHVGVWSFSLHDLAVDGRYVNCTIDVKLAKCGDDLKIIDYDLVRAADSLGEEPAWTTSPRIAKAAVKSIEADPPSYVWKDLPEVYEEVF